MALRADKAYSRRKNRDMRQARAIKVVIPEKSDAIARRQTKGSAAGRPLDFDAQGYKNRNVVERAFNKLKNWRGLATRYDKYALTEAASYWPRSCCGSHDIRDTP